MWYRRIFLKTVQKNQVSLKSHNHDGTWHQSYVQISNISLDSSYNEKYFSQKLYWKRKHNFMFQDFFPKIVPFMKIWKNTAWLDRPQWRNNKARVQWVLDNWSYRYTPRICNNYSFSTATVERERDTHGLSSLPHNICSRVLNAKQVPHRTCCYQTHSYCDCFSLHKAITSQYMTLK
jgi:hypothetical protein